ncbi:hypothetical protein L7F22_026906 [Adiantum nelumboides]|nr:hypothetical protein [Adiantum nelumboides]
MSSAPGKLLVKRGAKRTIEVVAEGAPKGPTQKRGKKVTKDKENSAQEGVQREHWKEHWVIQLIHIRCGMNNEFTKAHKQGVDLWSKVAIQLASLHPDCDKDAESCRKRWGRVYDSYKKDKLYLSMFGHDQQITCPWFDIIDQYMADRATVAIDASASPHTIFEGSKKVCLDSGIEAPGLDEECADAYRAKGDGQPTTTDSGGKGGSHSLAGHEKMAASRQRKVGKIEDSMSDMASSSKALLQR